MSCRLAPRPRNGLPSWWRMRLPSTTSPSPPPPPPSSRSPPSSPGPPPSLAVPPSSSPPHATASAIRRIAHRIGRLYPLGIRSAPVRGELAAREAVAVGDARVGAARQADHPLQPPLDEAADGAVARAEVGDQRRAGVAPLQPELAPGVVAAPKDVERAQRGLGRQPAGARGIEAG